MIATANGLDDELEATAFRLAPIGMVYAAHRIIMRANDAFASMFELDRTAAEGLTLETFYPSIADSQRLIVGIQGGLRSTGHYSDERTLRRINGDLFWCGVAGYSIAPEDPLAGVVWCFTDLSKQWNLSGLSPRDREIAVLTCGGRTAKEIARLLQLSPRTVESYLAKLKHKLAVRNVAELVSRIKPEGRVQKPDLTVN